MNIAQKIYDWFDSWRTPVWLKRVLDEVQGILIQVICQVGQDFVKKMQEKIIEVSGSPLENEEKFAIVFDFGKSLLPSMKDNLLNLLIEALVARLKENKVL